MKTGRCRREGGGGENSRNQEKNCEEEKGENRISRNPLAPAGGYPPLRERKEGCLCKPPKSRSFLERPQLQKTNLR